MKTLRKSKKSKGGLQLTLLQDSDDDDTSSSGSGVDNHHNNTDQNIVIQDEKEDEELDQPYSQVNTDDDDDDNDGNDEDDNVQVMTTPKKTSKIEERYKLSADDCSDVFTDSENEDKRRILTNIVEGIVLCVNGVDTFCSWTALIIFCIYKVYAMVIILSITLTISHILSIQHFKRGQSLTKMQLCKLSLCFTLIPYYRYYLIKYGNVNFDALINKTKFIFRTKNEKSFCWWAKLLAIKFEGFYFKPIEFYLLLWLLFSTFTIIASESESFIYKPFIIHWLIFCGVFKIMHYLFVALFFGIMYSNNFWQFFDIYSFLARFFAVVVGFQRQVLVLSYFLCFFIYCLSSKGSSYMKLFWILFQVHFYPKVIVAGCLSVILVSMLLNSMKDRLRASNSSIFIFCFAHSVSRYFLYFIGTITMGPILFCLTFVTNIYSSLFIWDAWSLYEMNINTYGSIVSRNHLKDVLIGKKYQNLFQFINQFCYYLIKSDANIQEQSGGGRRRRSECIIAQRQQIGCIYFQILSMSNKIVQNYNKDIIEASQIKLIPLLKFNTLKKLKCIENKNLFSSNTQDIFQLISEKLGEFNNHVDNDENDIRARNRRATRVVTEQIEKDSLKLYHYFNDLFCWKKIFLLFDYHCGNPWKLIDSELEVPYSTSKYAKTILFPSILITMLNSILQPFYILYFEIKYNFSQHWGNVYFDASLYFKLMIAITIFLYIFIFYLNLKYLIPLYSKLLFILTKENVMYLKHIFVLATKTQDYQEYFGNELITNIDQHLNNLRVRPFQQQVVYQIFGKDIGSLIMIYVPIHDFDSSFDE